MTLKEFAERRGVPLAQAQLWKRQGKIEQDDNGDWGPAPGGALSMDNRITRLESENKDLGERLAALEAWRASFEEGGEEE